MEIKEKKKTIELNERELLILKYISAGYSDAEIEKFLNLTHSTLRRSLDVLFRKTNVLNRSTLIAWGFRHNYLK